MENTEYELNIFTENGHIDFLMSCGNDDDVWITKTWYEFTKEERDKFVAMAKKFIDFANKFNNVPTIKF